MPFYRERVYPQLVRALGDPLPIRRIRQQLIPLAVGNVLEIGAGAGANFRHYTPARVKILYALEPNPGMIRLAKRQLQQTRLTVEFLDLPGERIPLPSGSIDTVVSTFTLCTIAGIAEALQGLRRVLKPDGKLIFFELGLSADPAVRRWQERLEPLARRVFGGLVLTRDMPALIVQGGFRIEHVESASLARFPQALSHCCWGTALANE